eukprot:9992143-Alexandrium_andersonii.AAC.1
MADAKVKFTSAKWNLSKGGRLHNRMMDALTGVGVHAWACARSQASYFVWGSQPWSFPLAVSFAQKLLSHE